MRWVATALLLVTCWSRPTIAADVMKGPTKEATSAQLQVQKAKAAMLVDAAKANELAKAAADEARNSGDGADAQAILATALWLQAEANYRLGDVVASREPLRAAAVLTRKAGARSQLMGDILLTRGGIHSAAGEPAGALLDYQNAYRIFRQIGNGRSQAVALAMIAGLYGDAKDGEGALRYLKQAIAHYRGDPGLTISLYNGRAAALEEMGRIDEAYEQFRLALSASMRARSPAARVRILVNIARNRLKAGKLADARSSIAEAVAISASGDAAAWRPQVLAVAAQGALQRGDLAKAAVLIRQSFAGIDLGVTSLSWREPHETAYTIYRREGRADLALPHLAAMKRIDDDATRLATTTGTALMAARFDFANQELRIATLRGQELQRRIELERTRANTQRTILYGGAGAAAIIVGLLVFALVSIRRSRDEVRAANDELAGTNTALSRALAAKTEFLATTSHEIRTPLNGILGMTEVMLADDRLAPLMRDRLGVVRGASITMRALVDDILDVAKMETGNLTIEDRPFDLAATLTDASRLWEEQARAKGVGFTARLENCPTWVMGDASRVRQVVFNLLSNALKFTSTGDVTLTAKADGEGVVIVVRDTGIGIPDDKQAQIFESFRQADTSTTRKFGGTGLGLTICRKLARAMGGDVTVASVIGEGATFTVSLPLCAATVDDAVPVPAERPDLLVVERNPIARAMWTSLLGRHASRIVFAANAQEAVACLEGGSIARILIDDATVDRSETEVARITDVAFSSETTLLWENNVDLAGRRRRTGVTRVVARPVSGIRLIEMLFVAQSDVCDADRLVSEAA